MKTKLTCLTILTSLSFSNSVLADAANPACEGDVIAQKFQGSFEANFEEISEKPVTMILSEKRVTVQIPGQTEDIKMRAWSCVAENADILVLSFEEGDYESRVIATTAGNIIDLGETYTNEDIKIEERIKDSASYDAVIYKRITE